MRALAFKALAFLAALGAAWWLGWYARGDVEQRQHAGRELAEARQALDGFAAEAKRLDGLAGRIQQQADALAGKTQTRIVEYRTHEKLLPLPADCRIDAERLRQLAAGVADVNAAIVATQPDRASAADKPAAN
ncbi:hypothetical protein B0T40_09875 [Chromobacterium haemolyticum]|uniref:hypothetical protein n=1 Tax=Chromobacterium haemolyticum TaxID=394935 RepID=UPI0009D96FA5|nr:hypothetical protein [Chromobacterium haemolyticum]OQS36691.1 hypothetical protein B0T40_09875 [Chromobacterium haemolyticum]